MAKTQKVEIPRAKVRGAVVMVKVAEIAPDPQNHNAMSSKDYSTLVASLVEFGFVDPLLVREKKGKRGEKYETINGEHRWRAAQDVGLAAVPCINLGVVSDAEAEQLAVVTNELGGDPDQVRLAERLRRINLGVPFEKLARIMPYSSTELKVLIGSVDFSFANLSTADARGLTGGDAVPDTKRMIFELPTKHADKVLAILGQVDSDAATALERCVLAYEKSPEFKPAAKLDVKKVRKVRGKV